MLHGGWSDSREWRLQIEGLSHQFDLIAWDAPGCGGSHDPRAGMRLADYAEAVCDLVGALDLEPVHLCGLSFGGGLAIAVYQRRPKHVRSLVLASAYAGWKGSLPAAEVDARLRRVQAEIHLPPSSWIDDYLPGFFAGPVAPQVLELVRSIMLEVRPAGTLPMLTAFAEADLRDVLPTIAVPTLLLYGSEDVRSPRPVAEALHAAIPGSRLVLLPGVGHVSNLEAPEVFNAEVRRFLRSVP
ncbi:alpha/beta fold hydrolase [Geodermatophilus chilensis]|uniref:alpha/beta fold hydrolase n=1 Tax=Geodermatophilus chilensis TaxID=2035835 RepID=UPI000C25937A|nr:alpha/beta fold hydrolase [Geodermatophilus chilensis]MDP9442407.1 alpha/beta hydrolase [Actinomycetota bacterium]